MAVGPPTAPHRASLLCDRGSHRNARFLTLARKTSRPGGWESRYASKHACWAMVVLADCRKRGGAGSGNNGSCAGASLQRCLPNHLIRRSWAFLEMSDTCALLSAQHGRCWHLKSTAAGGRMPGANTTICMSGRVATRRSSRETDAYNRLHVQLSTRMAYAPNLRTRRGTQMRWSEQSAAGGRGHTAKGGRDRTLPRSERRTAGCAKALAALARHRGG